LSTRILLISDLHLEKGRPDITAALFAFLARNTATCGALYILGDLFEVWIGDDEMTELSTSVAKALNSFHEAGSDIHILHGNRDFLLGTSYAASCGATLIDDSTVIDTPIGPALVLHGDDLCSDDVEYIKASLSAGRSPTRLGSKANRQPRPKRTQLWT
jgi:UDP-2,3-diacylglucosamine hydrolase